MDEHLLREIASQGLSDAIQCHELAIWATEYGEASGDARFMLLGSTLKEVADVWDDDGAGALSTSSLDATNRSLVSRE